jgi:hypothetical protein
MSFTQYTNLNFEDIKTSIKDYLRSNSNFSDFDFEGSNLSVIINTLAYNTYITAYNTNMVVNESFIDSATLRENIVSLARNIGYVPRSKRSAKASVNISISGISTTTKTITLQPGFVASGLGYDVNYNFSLPETVNIAANNGTANGIVDIYQGQYLEKNWTVDTSQPNQRYILPNDSIDTSTLRVKIQNTSTDTTITEFNLIDNIIGINSTSNIYLIQETTDEKYELLFGDGIFGKKLINGNIIKASYIRTGGVNGNGVSNFVFSGTIYDDNNAQINNFTGYIDPITSSENGDSIESVESIKYYAPRMYSAQYRAVTAGDYEAILPSIYPNIESVTAYGGEELNPPQYGKVFIAAKPRNGTYLSKFTKKNLLNSLKNYSIAGIVPQFVDLKYLYVELESYIYYNTNQYGDSNNLKSEVVSSLNAYANGTDFTKFGGRFKYSKTVSIIDNVNRAITSNITKVKMRRDLIASINKFAQYELCFDNEFYSANSEYNIITSGFTVYGIDGICYFADQPDSSQKNGRLFLFQLNGSDVKIISNKFGSVKYDTGEIIIDTVNITSTEKENNIIEVQVIPLSNDVLGRKEVYLQLDISKSQFYMLNDVISSGTNTAGTRFDTQSSYQTGNKTR